MIDYKLDILRFILNSERPFEMIVLKNKFDEELVEYMWKSDCYIKSIVQDGHNYAFLSDKGYDYVRKHNPDYILKEIKGVFEESAKKSDLNNKHIRYYTIVMLIFGAISSFSAALTIASMFNSFWIAAFTVITIPLIFIFLLLMLDLKIHPKRIINKIQGIRK